VPLIVRWPGAACRGAGHSRPHTCDLFLRYLLPPAYSQRPTRAPMASISPPLIKNSQAKSPATRFTALSALLRDDDTGERDPLGRLEAARIF